VAFGAPARADTVRLARGLVYEQVFVMDVSDGLVRFRTQSGSDVSKPLSDLTALELSGQEAVNQAERLLQEGKPAEAAAAYAALLKSGPLGWRKALARYRLLAAQEAAGQIDEAVRLWLEVCDESASPGHLALRPKKLPAAGSAANDKAIALLAAKAAKGETNKAYLRSLQQLLLDLYERQGKLDQAQALAAQMASETATQPSPGRGPAPATPAGGDLQLRQAGLALKKGDYAEVVGLVEGRLAGFSAADLPAALYFLGRAEMELAGKETNADIACETLLRAGLNLMRVVANFPDSQYAPEALYSAGELNQRLGNRAAAKAAYEAVVKRYGQSASAEKAAAALEAIQSKPKPQPR
jgi:TolA-binding protein